jgi:hypothetical protein
MITNDICKTCDGRCCYGCKYFNKVSGCTQEYEERYNSCKIYPFVERDGIIMLDPDCPGWRVFGEMYKEVVELVREAG